MSGNPILHDKTEHRTHTKTNKQPKTGNGNIFLNCNKIQNEKLTPVAQCDFTVAVVLNTHTHYVHFTLRIPSHQTTPTASGNTFVQIPES